MKERSWPCKITILDRKILMSEDSVFMDKDIISEKCNCNKANVCKMIVDLLNNWKIDEAFNLIKNDEV